MSLNPVNPGKTAIEVLPRDWMQISGFVIRLRNNQFGMLIDFFGTDGNLHTIKANTDLENKIILVPIKIYVTIRYKGMKDVSGGNKMKEFEVMSDPEVTYDNKDSGMPYKALPWVKGEGVFTNV